MQRLAKRTHFLVAAELSLPDIGRVTDSALQGASGLLV